ncbi:MAG: hypothetical protein GDA56_19285 [Hormoscilla sp. GM7CHS1pb]|nr:hypothetical protein [Hormoscilla sp. GM7CHS1pb]
MHLVFILVYVLLSQVILVFLEVLGSIASIAVAFLPDTPGIERTWAYQIINSLRDVPVMVYGGIKAIKNDDWLSATKNLLNAAVTLGRNFAQTIDSSELIGRVGGILNKVELVGNAGLAVAGAIKEDSLLGWPGSLALREF